MLECLESDPGGLLMLVCAGGVMLVIGKEQCCGSGGKDSVAGGILEYLSGCVGQQ